MDNAAAALSTTLHHVLFFLDRNEEQDNTSSPPDSISSNSDSSMSAPSRDVKTPVSGGPASAPTTRAISPTSGEPEHFAAKGSTSPLKADAPSFVPRTAAQPLFEIRASEGKGLGVFARQYIPRGTRVICEEPLLEIAQGNLDVAYHEYLRLSSDRKAVFDALHSYLPPHLDAEHAARICALHRGVSEADLTQHLVDHVRVISIFACNTFILANGNLGVFEVSSRLNHSCVPNVHHTNNPVLGKETVQAVRDIAPGEELQVNYMGAGATYEMQHVRLPKLQDLYGFSCKCVACSDPTGLSDQRRELLNGIFWGLNEYMSGAVSSGPFIPDSPSMALVQAEDGIRFMIEEQLLCTELIKAYRVASTTALAVHNYERALEYAFNEEEVEFNILGLEVNDLWRINMAAKQWVEKVYVTARDGGHTFKKSFLRTLSGHSRRAVQYLESKRVQFRSSKPTKKKKNKKAFTHAQQKSVTLEVEEGSALTEKENFSHAKKKSVTSELKKQAGFRREQGVQDENAAPPADAGEGSEE
ncbi:hypothetical protein CERZMDRAFT_81109 [Cercospora zeae-maydis SCOH1-5]|uniref:SET domain-containing protein n=1 Tax=Cercospora zeae-maydis SCOH1-5 TaxID=717836 RepID=A0A6A6FUT7_9PEZI|nr:hypothetical protein CERZMDRAFT_81109 [Cercospora zeae-maydis SCOH1-5]